MVLVDAAAGAILSYRVILANAAAQDIPAADDRLKPVVVGCVCAIRKPAEPCTKFSRRRSRAIAAKAVAAPLNRRSGELQVTGIGQRMPQVLSIN
jgi:hypothetical protein